jgi:hypothetical protein
VPTRSGRCYKYLEGVDATLDIAIGEYGLAWFDDPSKDEIEFFYAIGHDDDGNCTRFDNGWFRRDLDPKKEWDWIDDWNDVASFLGTSVEEFLKLPLTEMVCCLVNYYGHENIFGATYWGGWYWNKNLQRFQTVLMKEAQEYGRYKRMMKRNS